MKNSTFRLLGGIFITFAKKKYFALFSRDFFHFSRAQKAFSGAAWLAPSSAALDTNPKLVDILWLNTVLDHERYCPHPAPLLQRL
ncbi:hypothetical protein [Comamonas antarctica]|uniref:hypothetical protein n=1 Tax=Comamonas antarctica TaxID=2743470 RepID=UPI0028E93D08|nr:hypothetical protein [Comamonas antarctica]